MLLDRRPAGRRFAPCGHTRHGIEFPTTRILPRHGWQNALTLDPSLSAPHSQHAGWPRLDRCVSADADSAERNRARPPHPGQVDLRQRPNPLEPL